MGDDKESIEQKHNFEENRNRIEKQIIYYPHAETIDLNSFADDVEQIDLSLSRLTKIEDFSKFTALKSICFRSNLLKTLKSENLSSSRGLSQITELDFYDNQIEIIENLSELTTLENLDLSFNHFKKIENLDCLVNLIKLYFVHNQITKIENLEKLTKLEILELGDNQLRQIENLGTLVNLKELYLGKNKIRKFENLNLPNLNILSIQSNRIIKIENLDNLKNLTQLYLSDNGITKLEGIGMLTKLKTLDLSNNKIERLNVETRIQNLKELEEFWFSNNELSKWEDIDILKELPMLKCLYLEHNPIYYINNVKPSSIATDNQQNNSSYRRKIIFTLPNLEQLDATLCKQH